MASSFLSGGDERLACSSCGVPFKDFYYLMEEVVDNYLATARQLARHLRERHGAVLTPSKLASFPPLTQILGSDPQGV